MIVDGGDVLCLAVLHALDEVRAALVALLNHTHVVFVDDQVSSVLDAMTLFVESKLLLVDGFVLKVGVVSPVFFVPTTEFFFHGDCYIFRLFVLFLFIMKPKNKLLLKRRNNIPCLHEQTVIVLEA